MYYVGNIVINQGVIAAGAGGDGTLTNDNDQLGLAANKIILAPTTGTSTFRVTGNTVFNNRIIQLATNANTRAIEVTTGNTFQLNTPFDLNNDLGVNASLSKNDNGTLWITANNSGWNGNVTVSGGALKITNALALGTGTISISAFSNAALQVSGAAAPGGGLTINNPLNLNQTSSVLNGGVQNGGQLEILDGNDTYAGVITFANDGFIGVDAGATLNITGGINAANSTTFHQIEFGGAGTVNLSSLVQNTFGFDKVGTGILNITSAQTSIVNNQAASIVGGTVNLTGAGTLQGLSVASRGILINYGALLTINDNSATPIANRLEHHRHWHFPDEPERRQFCLYGDDGGRTELFRSARHPDAEHRPELDYDGEPLG